MLVRKVMLEFLDGLVFSLPLFLPLSCLAAVGNLEQCGSAHSLVPFDQLHEREHIRMCIPEGVVDFSVSRNYNILLQSYQFLKCKMYLPVPGLL